MKLGSFSFSVCSAIQCVILKKKWKIEIKCKIAVRREYFGLFHLCWIQVTPAKASQPLLRPLSFKLEALLWVLHFFPHIHQTEEYSPKNCDFSPVVAALTVSRVTVQGWACQYVVCIRAEHHSVFSDVHCYFVLQSLLLSWFNLAFQWQVVSSLYHLASV